jgi:hypothetical protein
MRTKSVILGAAILAAGVATSMAQSNVYSLNVVGYINLTIVPGLNCVANQLDLDGTGTNNTLTNVFGAYPWANGTTIYKFVSGTPVPYAYSHGAFGSAAGVSMNPGEGCFVYSTASSNITVTTVGQVLQGTWTNNLTPPLTLVSAIAPLANTVDSTGNGGLGYTPASGDSLYIWDNTLVPPNYDIYTYSHGHFSPDPTIQPGEGFFIDSSNTSWTNTFTVQ